MRPLPEYPHLEALLEAENGQPTNDYAVLAKILVPLILSMGVGLSILLGLMHSWSAVLPIPIAAAIGVPLWFLLMRLDQRVSKSKAKLRKLCEEIWHRYCDFSNLVGIDPALSDRVGSILDEAAGIYLKHSRTETVLDESHKRALEALENAMAQMLELGRLKSVPEQELEFSAGWAVPLIQAMRELDQDLDRYRMNALAAAAVDSRDPLRQLREARIELQSRHQAIEEIEERH